MTHRDWDRLLDNAPKTRFEANLVRCVPQAVFDSGKPPSYLFTSGKPGRCNPNGVLCLYMSEGRKTALCEYDKYFVEPQPHIAFYGNLETAAIIDLEDPATQKHFGVDDTDFFKNFRLKPHRTPLQSLGLAISKQSRVTGIRFPSTACHVAGTSGFNLVVFKGALTLPDSLEILGAGKTVLEKWP